MLSLCLEYGTRTQLLTWEARAPEALVPFAQLSSAGQNAKLVKPLPLGRESCLVQTLIPQNTVEAAASV